LLATPVWAGGFQIFEKNTSDLGRAFAGGAAIAEDATTIGTNPAGMALLDRPQVAAAITLVDGRAKVNLDKAGVFIPGPGLQASPRRLESENAAPNDAWIPAFYGTVPLSETITLGFGAFSNFSTATEYDQDFAGSLLALDSDIRTINVNPSISYRLNSNLSFGAGFNAVQAQAKISATNPAIGPLKGPDGATLLGPDGSALVGPTGEILGYSEVAGRDWGYGWNVGALYEFSDQARIGLAYRSPVELTLEGTTEFKGTPNVDQFTDFDAEAPLDLPDILSLSGYYAFAPQWSLSADITRTGWSRFENLKVYREADQALTTFVREDWQDVYRYALGLAHKYNQNLTLRTGLAYDESPIPNARRTLRIPTQDTTWLAFGGQYRLGDSLTFDAGYAHLFMDDASINEERNFVGQAFVAQAKGEASVSIDIFSLQMSYLL
jgi:long-chain fatty acid transport protein